MIAHLDAVSFAPDQTGFAQNPEVIGQRGFWDDPVPNCRDSRAGFDTTRLHNLGEDGCPVRIGERVQDRLWTHVPDRGVKQRSHISSIWGLEQRSISSEVPN